MSESCWLPVVKTQSPAGLDRMSLDDESEPKNVLIRPLRVASGDEVICAKSAWASARYEGPLLLCRSLPAGVEVSPLSSDLVSDVVSDWVRLVGMRQTVCARA